MRKLQFITGAVLRILIPVVLLVCLILFVVFKSQQEKKELTDEVRHNAPGQFIKLEHGLVHYRLEGSDSSDLIVFMHGGGIIGMEIWDKNLHYFLNKGYRVLALDLYGRGYSARPDTEHSPGLYHDQLVQLLDRLNIAEPFYLVAHSMGAIIALDYLHSSPERVKKTVLIDPMILGNFEPSPLLKVPVVSNLLMTLYWYPRAIENQRKEFVSAELFESYARRLAYFMNIEGYKQTNHSTWMHTLNQDRTYLMKEMTPVNMLVVYGDQDPYFNDQNGLYQFAKTLEVKKAGHLPQYEQPEKVNQAILMFIETGRNPGVLTSSK